jgi:hypothetical protein
MRDKAIKFSKVLGAPEKAISVNRVALVVKIPAVERLLK